MGEYETLSSVLTKKGKWSIRPELIAGLGLLAGINQGPPEGTEIDPKMVRNPYKTLQNDDFWSKSGPDED